MPDRIAFVDQHGDTLATATNDILGGQLARLVAEMDALDAEAVVVEALPACELSRREGIGHAVEMLRDALDVTLPAETVESVRNHLFATQEMVKILRAQVRRMSADREWLIAHADDALIAAFINARRDKAAAAPGGAEGSAVAPSVASGGLGVAARNPMEMVAEFHRVFGLPMAFVPTTEIRGALADLRLRILREEVNELADAVADRDVVAIADALGEIVYVVYGHAVTNGIPLDAVVAEVHRSNMSKLGADGLAILRADGKVEKGPNYEPPDIARVLAGAAQHPEGGDRG